MLRVLLWVHESEHGPGLIDPEVAHTAGGSEKIVVRLRLRFVEEGLEIALERREKSQILEGDSEARIVALMCSKPPARQSHWTLRLLRDRLVELGVVGSISRKSVRQFKKALLNLGGKRCVVSRPSRIRLLCARWSRYWRFTSGSKHSDHQQS